MSLSPARSWTRCAGWRRSHAFVLRFVTRFAGSTGGYHRSPGLRGGAKVRRSWTGAEDAVARIPIEMPKLGYDMETGRVGSWLKKVGDRVTRGEPIAEIETEKSTVEMEATASGTLAEITAEAGAELPVGEVIGYLDEEG
jgi:multidrug efflux pump subunit AcrA (membrane-fusion protein)